MAATTGLAAAAAVAGVLVVAGASGERATIRTPATVPTALPTSTTVTEPTAPSVPASTVPATTAPATSTVATPVPPPVESTETFEGIGGTITVRLRDGTLTLATEPSATPGFTTRIDDDGPDRVRVRFERDDERTEIRVELEGGRLVPTIEEN